MKCTVVDYGLCNLLSVSNALYSLGVDAIITDDPRDIEQAVMVILPGVGAFKDGMQGLRERNLIMPLQMYAASGKPLLGICLGMQMLMTRSFEFGEFEGLNLVAGEVKRFDRSVNSDGSIMRIPHIGWNGLYRGSNSWDNTILHGLSEGEDMYFVHSYKVIPSNHDNVLAVTTYIDQTFCSVVKKDNIYGCQFHPEKSSFWGVRILGNFIKLVSK
jgi:glutamine amidotransferase